MTRSSLVDSVGGLTNREWDSLAGRHFYSSSAWVRYCAKNSPGRVGALTVDLGGGRAVAPVSEVIDAPPLLYRWAEILKSAGLPQLPAQGIMIGVLQGYQGHFLIDPLVDRVAAVGALVQEARRLNAGAGKGSSRARVGMYLTTQDVQAARSAGVQAMPVLLDTDAWMDVPAGGWTAWLDTLTSKRRVAIRREVRRFTEAGYQVSHEPLSDRYPDLAPLAMATQAKYGQTAELDFYAGLLKAHVDGMGEAARVAICARDGGKPVGFCVYYVWQGTVFLRWAGFDYTQTVEAAEYFNLVYYSHIKAAPQTGVRRIHAGIKAIEAKALRGASLHPLWLLDLAEDSPLAAAAGQVREHNRRLTEATLKYPSIKSSVADPDQWLEFC